MQIDYSMQVLPGQNNFMYAVAMQTLTLIIVALASCAVSWWASELSSILSSGPGVVLGHSTAPPIFSIRLIVEESM